MSPLRQLVCDVMATIRRWFRRDSVVELDIGNQPSNWRAYRVRASTAKAAMNAVDTVGHVDDEKGTCIRIDTVAALPLRRTWYVECQYSRFPIHPTQGANHEPT